MISVGQSGNAHRFPHFAKRRLIVCNVGPAVARGVLGDFGRLCDGFLGPVDFLVFERELGFFFAIDIKHKFLCADAVVRTTE